MNKTSDKKPKLNEDEYPGIAGLLVKEGYLEPDKYKYAQRVRGKLSTQPPLLEVIRELGYTATEEIQKALRDNRLFLRIGDLLTELGCISESELQAALTIQKEQEGDKLLGEILLEQHFIEEHELVEVLANQLGFPLVFPNFSEADSTLLKQVTPRWCEQYKFFPFEMLDNGIVIAFVNPMSQQDLSAAETSFGSTIIPAIATESSIKNALAVWEQNLQSIGGNKAAIAGSAVNTVNSLIMSAIEVNASDIHIEPMKDHLQVRFRCDGVLRHHMDFGNDMTPSLTARLKVMAHADIAEKRRHQGGRILFEDKKTGLAMDIRASFYSTIYGKVLYCGC